MLTFNFDPFPTLNTSRLVLRRITTHDASEIFFFRSNPEMMSFIPKKKAESIDEAYEWIRKIDLALNQNTGITWGIALNDDPSKIIGTIGFWHTIPDHHRAEIGYQLHTDFRGKGLMDESLKAILVYGFDQMNLHSVMANVDPNNQPSIKLLERNGFVREGYFKEDYHYDGVFYDSAIYSLLKKSYD